MSGLETCYNVNVLVTQVTCYVSLVVNLDQFTYESPCKVAWGVTSDLGGHAQVDNFIHADLHPGNILVRMAPGNPAPNKQMFRSRPHVVLLDVGMTAELNPRDRYTLIDFFKAIALKDGRKAAECTLKFSRAQNCPNPTAFIDVSGYGRYLFFVYLLGPSIMGKMPS